MAFFGDMTGCDDALEDAKSQCYSPVRDARDLEEDSLMIACSPPKVAYRIEDWGEPSTPVASRADRARLEQIGLSLDEQLNRLMQDEPTLLLPQSDAPAAAAPGGGKTSLREAAEILERSLRNAELQAGPVLEAGGDAEVLGAELYAMLHLPPEAVTRFILRRLEERANEEIARAAVEELGVRTALLLLRATIALLGGEHAVSGRADLTTVVPSAHGVEQARPRTGGGVYIKLLKGSQGLDPAGRDAALLRIKHAGERKKQAGRERQRQRVKAAQNLMDDRMSRGARGAGVPLPADKRPQRVTNGWG
jgi:hypothetical protein